MAAVELILLQRVEKLGQMGEIVKVKPGFARNYLLPQKKALRATTENRAYFDNQKAQLEAQNLRRKEEAERMAVSQIFDQGSGDTTKKARSSRLKILSPIGLSRRAPAGRHTARPSR